MSSFSTGSCMEPGAVRRWHTFNDDDSAGPELFAIRNVTGFFRVETPSGRFIGLYADFEAARLAGFAWYESEEDLP